MKETIKLIAIVLVSAVIGGFTSGLVGNNQPVSFGAQSHTNSGYVINEDGTDDDSRIESDNDAEALWVDAGNDVVTLSRPIESGGNTTLTDADGGTYTLTEAELLGARTLTFAAGGLGQEVIALTLPATSTMTTLIDDAGECASWLYDASALAAATTTTITAGTGHDVIAVTTNDDVIDGAEWSLITMCRQADSDVTTIVSELLHAD